MMTQNKKIAISAVSLFLVSFSILLFTLEGGGNVESGHNQANVMGSSHTTEGVAEIVDPEVKYEGYIGEEKSPFFVTTADGKIVYSSKDFCRLLSVKCDDFVGEKFFDYINSKDLSDVVSDQTKIIQSGKSVTGIGPYRMIKGKKEVLLLLNAYPILDKDEKVSEIVFAVKDLTNQVEELNKEKPAEDEETWIDNIYPKIKEMKDNSELKMVVDKISYKAE